MERSRIKYLNHPEVGKGEFVLYWMQASQRTLHNHALEFSINEANELGLPLIVFFGIFEDYPEANERHFKFMLDGLKEVSDQLRQMDIKFVIRTCSPLEGALELSLEAALVVTDKGYLRHQTSWRQKLGDHCEVPVHQVETDVIVPVEIAAGKEMYSAATLRSRIHRKIDDFLFPPQHKSPKISSLDLDLEGIDISQPDRIIKEIEIDRKVPSNDRLKGGTSEALNIFHDFLKFGLDRYHLDRSDPSLGIQSNMSPYLHFGQISPITLALEVNEAGSPGTEKFLEELIVRRELAFNFVHYNPNYDSIQCLPNWARQTLEDHSKDLREYVYSIDELERGNTHDPYWNAAQKEMAITGKMHNYMRMYWGKKIIEWMEEPSEAYKTALYLNNKYSLDGRDPNSYAGVAWCFGKHDRPWTERPIFGKVRYMNDRGLERKFLIDNYVKQVERMGQDDV